MYIKLLTGGGLALALVLLLAVNIVSQGAFRSARLDLTEHDLYTLSEGTTNILANLAEPVTLRLFISQKLATRLAGISGYATRVEELLKEFKRAADGKLRLRSCFKNTLSCEASHQKMNHCNLNHSFATLC
jgi:gliding motility-associatede transport system auxiliary component